MCSDLNVAIRRYITGAKAPLTWRTPVREHAAAGTGAARVASVRARLPLDPDEFRCCPTENLDPVLVTEPGNRHDVVDRGSVPREWVIGPEDHVIDPRLGDQVPHALAREHDRIEIQLSAS